MIQSRIQLFKWSSALSHIVKFRAIENSVPNNLKGLQAIEGSAPSYFE